MTSEEREECERLEQERDVMRKALHYLNNFSVGHRHYPCWCPLDSPDESPHTEACAKARLAMGYYK